MKQHKFIFLLILTLSFAACKQEVYTPKPKSYFRIDLPQKQYQAFNTKYCPLSFQYPTYGNIEQKVRFFNDAPDHPCWMNISMPQFNSKLHLTYVEIDSEEKLEQSIYDANKYAMKHAQKADYIDETTIINDNMNAKLFDLGGNVASSIQFYATDSSEHFLRGSLYFNQQPNVDSLRPVIDFLREDVEVLIKSLQW